MKLPISFCFLKYPLKLSENIEVLDNSWFDVYAVSKIDQQSRLEALVFQCWEAKAKVTQIVFMLPFPWSLQVEL